MPGFNGSGPRGQGPLTGRGMGACAGPERTFFSQGRGMGFGMGRRGGIRGGGRGFGFGVGFNPNFGLEETPEQTLDRLQKEKDFYEERMRFVDTEISHLKKGS